MGSSAKTLGKDFGISLWVTTLYLGLFTLIEVTLLLSLARLSTHAVLSVLSQYATPLIAFVGALNFFLGLGLWLCSIDILKEKRNFLSLLHLPLFKIAALSVIPALGLLPPLFLLGPFGFFIGFLWTETIGIFFLSTVLVVLRGHSLSLKLWNIGKQVYSSHRSTILGVLLCLAIAQVAFIHFVSENNMGAALALTALFFLLLPIHFRVLFHGIRLSVDKHIPKETTKAINAPLQRHRVLSRTWLVSGIVGVLFLSINGFQQKELDQRFQKMNNQIRLQQTKNKYQRPVLRGKALAGNGNAAYWEIIGKTAGPEAEKEQEEIIQESLLQKNYPDLGEALHEDREAFTSDRGIQSQPALTPKYRPVIEALQTAAAHAYIQSDDVYAVNAPLPDFLNVQDLAAIMTSLAITQCQSDHCLAGGELLMDTLRLGQDLAYRGTLIEGMVGIVVKEKTLRAGLSQLNHQQLSAQELKVLTSRMETLLYSEKTLQDALTNEFLRLQRNIYDLNQKPPEASALLTEFTTFPEYPFAFLFFKPFLKPLMIDALNTLDIIRAQYDRIYLLPRSQQNKAMQTLKAELEDTLTRNIIIAVTLPNLTGGWEREMNAHLEMSAAYLYLALETYHAEKESYPEHLEALVPDIIPKLPLDPWTGQMLKYKRLTPETFTFYSFGKAGKLGKTTAYFDPSKQHCKKESTLIFSNVFVTPPSQDPSDLPSCENNLHLLAKG